jgi:hypothetical protein
MLALLAVGSVTCAEATILSSISPAAAGRVFICYRRDDAAYPASWLFDQLVKRYGAARLFEDVNSIQLGDDFVEVITAAVQSCRVLLAVIGKRWLDAVDEDGRRRLDDPEDFVRLEIEGALQRNVRIIPILVDGARMPRAAELPESLKKLARRQAFELGPAQFAADIPRLLKVLDGIGADEGPHSSPAQATNRPNPVSFMPPRLPGEEADARSAANTLPDYPAGFDPDSYQPPKSEAEIRERQARIQADLNEGQEEFTNMAADRYRWISTMQEMWQKERPEILRKLGMQDVSDISPDESAGSDQPPEA